MGKLSLEEGAGLWQSTMCLKASSRPGGRPHDSGTFLAQDLWHLNLCDGKGVGGEGEGGGRREGCLLYTVRG